MGKFDKQIEKLDEIKDMVIEMYNSTDEEVAIGNLMCDIDETIGALETKNV